MIKERHLTPKEGLFVAEYLLDFNGTKAAIRAKYSKKSARQQAARLLSKAYIREALRAAIQRQEEKALMKAYEVERSLDAIIRSNLKDYVDAEGNLKPLHELTEDQAACISEFTETETPLGYQRKLKFFNKLDAIGKKMQRLGLLKADAGNNGATVTVIIERSGCSTGKQAWPEP